jgi:hypothetical protein
VSERRQLTMKDFLYIAAAIGGLGSMGWLFRIANAVESGKEAKVRVEKLEPMVAEQGTQIAVMSAKMDYVVQTLGKIDRRMERRER